MKNRIALALVTTTLSLCAAPANIRVWETNAFKQALELHPAQVGALEQSRAPRA